MRYQGLLPSPPSSSGAAPPLIGQGGRDGRARLRLLLPPCPIASPYEPPQTAQGLLGGVLPMPRRQRPVEVALAPLVHRGHASLLLLHVVQRPRHRHGLRVQGHPPSLLQVYQLPHQSGGCGSRCSRRGAASNARCRRRPRRIRGGVGGSEGCPTRPPHALKREYRRGALPAVRLAGRVGPPGG